MEVVGTEWASGAATRPQYSRRNRVNKSDERKKKES
jgi:hypothetical protein